MIIEKPSFTTFFSKKRATGSMDFRPGVGRNGANESPSNHLGNGLSSSSLSSSRSRSSSLSDTEVASDSSPLASQCQRGMPRARHSSVLSTRPAASILSWTRSGICCRPGSTQCRSRCLYICLFKYTYVCPSILGFTKKKGSNDTV